MAASMVIVFGILFMIFLLGVQVGAILVGRQTTRHLREQNDLLERQNKIIAHYTAQDDGANWWKKDWEPGDA